MSTIIFSGTYLPLCGVEEVMVYVNGTDGGTAEELGRAVVVMGKRNYNIESNWRQGRQSE